jgi:hypothetical protein
MNGYTYLEIDEKLTELDYTQNLCNYIQNAIREVDDAIYHNHGVMQDDDKFLMKLHAVLKELNELNDTVVKSYGITYRKFVTELSNSEEEKE